MMSLTGQDSPEKIIDSSLAQTDIGRVLLEADLQLKKDTSKATSPDTPEGREYWDKLYQKANQLLGYENITIPTLVRPWIVPDEIIVRGTSTSAYVYKATLKVMLEEDYLKSPQSIVRSPQYNFQDERLKQLNEYSAQLIRELIIPKLTKEINTSKRYAPLRQVYYSLILAQWFKARFSVERRAYSVEKSPYVKLINSRDLANLTSKDPWSKTTYFKEYQKSFKEGEYHFQEPVSTIMGRVVRTYMSGGMNFSAMAPGEVGSSPVGPVTAIAASSPIPVRGKDFLAARRNPETGEIETSPVQSFVSSSKKIRLFAGG